MKNNIKKAVRAFTLVEIMIVVLIIGILLAIAVPNFIRAREQTRAKSCSANLRQIDGAKSQWAMDRGIAITNGTAPTLDSDPVTGLVGPSLYIKAVPSCPSTGQISDYNVGNVAVSPTCNNSTPTYLHTANGN